MDSTEAALPPVAGKLNLLLEAVEYIEGARGNPAALPAALPAAPPAAPPAALPSALPAAPPAALPAIPPAALPAAPPAALPAALPAAPPAALPAVLPVRRGRQKERVIPQEEKEQAQELLEKLEKKRKETGKMCTICSADEYRTFTAVSSLINHLRSKHLGLKMFKCDKCDATFTRRHSLKHHMKVHYGVFTLTCKHCSKRFRHGGHLKEHLREHSGEKPYRCDECAGVAFRTYGMYKRHLKTVHNSILTWRGKAPMSEEELAKVKTKRRYHESSPSTRSVPSQASPSTTPRSSSSEAASPSTSAAAGISSPFTQGPSYAQLSLTSANMIYLVQQPPVMMAYTNNASPGVVARVSPQRPDSQPSMGDVQLVASTL